MARNISNTEQKYPKRVNRKKLFEDDNTWELGRNLSNKTSKNWNASEKLSTQYENNECCEKCNRICKTKNGLAQHQRKCLLPSTTESFLKNIPKKESYDITNKIALPLTQPDKTSTPSTPEPDKISQDSAKKLSQPSPVSVYAEVDTSMEDRTNSNTNNLVPDMEINTRTSIIPSNEPSIGCQPPPELRKQQWNDPLRNDAGHNAIDNTNSNTTPSEQTSYDIAADEGNINCPTCRQDVDDHNRDGGILCNLCNNWFHQQCLHMTDNIFRDYKNSIAPWFCVRCLSIKANNIKWGTMEGEEIVIQSISSIYDEICRWSKNLFMLPRGKVGIDFIRALTKIFEYFVNDTRWSRVALSMAHIFIPLMLQKPSRKSKAKQHSIYLEKRLKWWQEGDLNSIMAEGREIQTRLKNFKQKKRESKEKAFCRLMLLGKVADAMKFLNNDEEILGLHSMTATVKEILQSKHPAAETPPEDALLPPRAQSAQPVIFEDIDGETIYRAAKNLQGSGGPTLIDADGWKHILCSRSYGKASTDLCEVIANMTKKLCCEEVQPDSLREFVACRLIPLDKGVDKNGNLGVRPIGIGEILRRIIGKAVVSTIKDDIVSAAGPLQTCAGLQSGIEASIHAMKTIYEDPLTEAVLLVDAENAFNKLNRKAALHNIKELCPPFYRYLYNTYQQPAKLNINDNVFHDHILSEEGSTQGDVAAMGMYAIAIRPLIDKLHLSINKEICKQVWYADDSSSGGKIEEIKKWWNVLNAEGPKYGYHPKASKCIMIVKDENLHIAQEVFGSSGITITTSGDRHLGAVIGSHQFREQYVNNKVDNWIKDIEHLTTIAKDEPQIAHSAFTKALSRRWSFFQRTIPDIESNLQPLEDVIREKLIPAIVGKSVSDVERDYIALPVRYGGLGIENPASSSKQHYEFSTKVTEHLTELIYQQNNSLANYDKDVVENCRKKLREKKEQDLKNKYEEVLSNVDARTKKALILATEKGAGSWLTALPIQNAGFVLNKQEFRDGICLRYNWKIPSTASHCACGEKSSVNHSLNCKLGGFVHMRHDAIRDLEADLLKDICKDVKVEPELQPIGNLQFDGANTAQKARLDVSAVGLWSKLERTFVDVRIMHPESPSYQGKSPEQIYAMHEREKKRQYNQRVLQVEKGSFTPLVFSTTGGMGPEATKYHKRVAELLSVKRNEEYSHTMSYVRTRLRFCLLRSILIAVRGERGKRRKFKPSPVSELSLNLLPLYD